MMSSEARHAGQRVITAREKNLEHSSRGLAVVTLTTARTTNESRGTVCTDAEVWYRWRHKRFPFLLATLLFGTIVFLLGGGGLSSPSHDDVLQLIEEIIKL